MTKYCIYKLRDLPEFCKMIYTPYTLGVQPGWKHPGGQKEERSCVSSGQFHPADVAIHKMDYRQSKHI